MPRIALVTLLAVVVTVGEKELHVEKYTLTTTPFTLVGVALGIFLGFRNDAAYDRFWEGRKLWGTQVNRTRSLTRKITMFIRPPDGDAEIGELHELQHELVLRVIAHTHALRHLLRQTSPQEDLERLLPAADVAALADQRNVPIAVLQQLGQRLRETWQRGWIHDYHLTPLEDDVAWLTDVQGACERIKNTPIPYTYSVLVHRIVAVYCLTLPFGLIDTVGWLTPAVVFLISYAFFGLDAIGNEIEDPFGTESNHLPLEAISNTIEINLRQLIGDEQLPPAYKPVDGVAL